MRYNLLLTNLVASTSVLANVVARQDTSDPKTDDAVPSFLSSPFGNASPECITKLQAAAAAAPTEPPELQQYWASQGINVLTNLCSLSLPNSLTKAESSYASAMASWQNDNAALISSCVTLDPALGTTMSLFGSAYRAACSETGSAAAAPTGNGGATKAGSTGPAETGSGSANGGKGNGDKPKKNAAGQIVVPATGLLAVLGFAALF